MTLAHFATGADPAPDSEKKQAASDSADVTAEMRELNSDKFSRPPSEFRAGHVTPRKLDDKAITVNDKGFRVKLPSNAPIPTPSVYRGKLYVSGGFHSKEFYCFDASTGKPVWAVDLDDDGPTSAVCEDGVVVFNTESCTVFGLDADTGKHLWSYYLGDPLTSTPTIAHGKVFTSYPASGRGQQAQDRGGKGKDKQSGADDKPLPNASHVLACIELKTGKILWQHWLDSDVMSAPIAVDREIYLTSFAGTVYQFKQDDGQLVSAQRTRATSAPVIVGQHVYLTRRADSKSDKTASEQVAAVDRGLSQEQFAGSAKEAKYLDAAVQGKSSLKGQGMALDASNGFAAGAPAAANPDAPKANIGQDNVATLQAFQGSRALHMAGQNFNCMGDELICTSADGGKKTWSVKLGGDLEKAGGALAASPAAAAGQIFLATLQGDVLQIDPKNGEVRATYKVGAPLRFQPAIEGGRIYVGTQDGQVVCINTGDAKLTGWSTWGGNAAHSGVAARAK